MMRLITHKEVEKIQVAMLKKQLSDRECARMCGRSLKDYRDIVFKKKKEENTRIHMMVGRITNE